MYKLRSVGAGSVSECHDQTKRAGKGLSAETEESFLKGSISFVFSKSREIAFVFFSFLLLITLYFDFVQNTKMQIQRVQTTSSDRHTAQQQTLLSKTLDFFKLYFSEYMHYIKQ